MIPNIYYQIACRGVLGLRTNIKGFRWSFAQCAPEADEDEYQKCLVRISLFLERDAVLEKRFPPLEETTHYFHFRGKMGGDGVYYQRIFSGSSYFLLISSGLIKGDPIIYANPRYYRFIKLRLMNIHSLNFLLTDVAAFELLRNGLAAIHCSAFTKGDKTVVIFAPSNTGKTLTVMKVCMDYGARFLAEDMAVTDGTKLFPVPWTSTFMHYEEVDSSLRAKLTKRLNSLFPPLALFPIVRQKPVTSFINLEPIYEESRVTHLVVLERGGDSVSKGHREEVYQKVSNLNLCEYNYVRSPLLLAYEFLNPILNIRETFAREAFLLKQLAGSVDECIVVRARNPVDFAPRLIEAIEGKV